MGSSSGNDIASSTFGTLLGSDPLTSLGIGKLVGKDKTEGFFNDLIGGLSDNIIGLEDDKFTFNLKDSSVGKGLKHITGAKAAEDANRQARDQFEEQKAAALQDREIAKAQNTAQQLQASRSAGGSKRSTSSRSSAGVNRSTGSNLGGAERDFLGL